MGPGLRWVIESCRNAHDGWPLADFSLGLPIERCVFEELLPAEVRSDLATEQLLVPAEADQTRLDVRCQSFNGIVSIMPAVQAADADMVHLNVDSFWLLQLAWRLGDPGDTAVELATGNGIIAAYLIARYRRVVATDVAGPWLRFAALTLEANRGRGRPSQVVCCDVAAGLRPRSFDLVLANAPWSPSFPEDSRGRRVLFADGGPTGTELPSRFLREGAELLKPGGTAITLAFEPEFANGDRPLHRTIDDLRRSGYDVEVVESAVFPAEVITARLQQRLPDLVYGRHVAAVVRLSA